MDLARFVQRDDYIHRDREDYRAVESEPYEAEVYADQRDDRPAGADLDSLLSAEPGTAGGMDVGFAGSVYPLSGQLSAFPQGGLDPDQGVNGELRLSFFHGVIGGMTPGKSWLCGHPAKAGRS